MTHGFLNWSVAGAALMLVLTPPLQGQFSSGEQSAEELVPVRVYAERDRIGPGETVHLAVAAEIARGWHIYWMNPGAAGLSTEVEVAAPPGFRVGKARFPRPHSFKEPEGITYGYEREAIFFVPIEAPATLAAGEVTFRVNLRFLVCKSVCLMGSAERSLVLTTAASATVPEPAPWSGLDSGTGSMLRARFEAMPKPLEKQPHASARMDGSILRIAGPARDQHNVVFFPVELPGVIYGKAEMTVAGDRFSIAVPVEINQQNMLGQTPSIRGLVALGERLADPSFEFDIPLPAPEPPHGEGDGTHGDHDGHGGTGEE